MEKLHVSKCGEKSLIPFFVQLLPLPPCLLLTWRYEDVIFASYMQSFYTQTENRWGKSFF
jgi:hypothetical protein